VRTSALSFIVFILVSVGLFIYWLGRKISKFILRKLGTR
jgi:hypothetical protein